MISVVKRFPQLTKKSHIEIAVDGIRYIFIVRKILGFLIFYRVLGCKCKATKGRDGTWSQFPVRSSVIPVLTDEWFTDLKNILGQ